MWVECTVTPGLSNTGLSNTGLSNTGLSDNLIYPTLCCESPSLRCVQSTLIYPTPGSSHTFYEEQMWSDKREPAVHTYVHTYVTCKCTWCRCTYARVYTENSAPILCVCTYVHKASNTYAYKYVLIQKCCKPQFSLRDKHWYSSVTLGEEGTSCPVGPAPLPSA